MTLDKETRGKIKLSPSFFSSSQSIGQSHTPTHTASAPTAHLHRVERVDGHRLQPQDVLHQVSLFDSSAALQGIPRQEELEVVNDARWFQFWNQTNRKTDPKEEKT